MKINILHEDDDIIVCVKPAGVPSQPDKTNDEDMESCLKNYLFEKYMMDEEPYLALLHRLDRPVGGIMVFAKNKAAAADLSGQISAGKVVKYYQAILTGELSEEAGTLVDYMLKDGRSNLSQLVPEGTKGAKRAELEYEVLDVFDTDKGVLSYVLIRLLTGRHHQIRVQMAGHGAGIYGDSRYNPVFTKKKQTGREIALYAARLEFTHPSTGERLVFKHEPEGDIFNVIEMEDF